jgi:hypothetical protein
MVALGSIGRVLLPGVVFGVLTLAATAAGARVIVPVPPAAAVGTLLYAHGQGRSDALLRFEKKNPFCRWHPRHRLCAKLVALVRFCDRHPRHRLCEQADDDRFCKRNQDHRDCDDDRFCRKNPYHRLCERADDDRFCKVHRKHPLCDDDRFCSKHPKHPKCDDPPSPS